MIVGTAAEPTPMPAQGPTLGPDVVLVPVKAFAQAKQRLGAALSDQDRRALVQRMAELVVAASAPLSVAVVCDDTEVANWARRRGAMVIWEPGRGLNGAVQAGVDQLAQRGAQWITVAHGDLPRAAGLGAMERFAGVTLVPDRADDGTNVIRLPARCGFRFSYGAGSFSRHRAECVRLKLAARILRVPTLAFDVDWPRDLDGLDL